MQMALCYGGYILLARRTELLCYLVYQKIQADYADTVSHYVLIFLVVADQ